MPPVPTRKHEPGNKKLKRKRRLDDLEKSQSGDIVKYFKPPPTTNTENTIENNNSTINSDEDDTTADDNSATRADDNGTIRADDNGATRVDDDFAKSAPNIIENTEVNNQPLDVFDPGNWNVIDKPLRDKLVRRDPMRILNHDYARGKKNRRFSDTYYT